MQLTERNIQILKIIVDEYLETWEVLGSKLLLQKYDLWVSSATVRADMAKLEKLELVFQPYNSAWRLPTSKGLRAFVNFLMSSTPNYLLKEKNIELWWNNIKKLSDFIHKITYELAKNTWEIAFFVIPEKNIIEYSWIANFIQKNGKKLWDDIFLIVKMLEDKFNFAKFISNFPINTWINTFIWEENFMSYLKDYSIIIKPIKIDWETWYVWIIWWLQMNYSFNISAVKWII
jgi:transcriptional regulator of heat shock response